MVLSCLELKDGNRYDVPKLDFSWKDKLVRTNDFYSEMFHQHAMPSTIRYTLRSDAYLPKVITRKISLQNQSPRCV